MVFHFDEIDTLNSVDEFTRFIVDAHLSTKTTWIVVGDGGCIG